MSTPCFNRSIFSRVFHDFVLYELDCETFLLLCKFNSRQCFFRIFSIWESVSHERTDGRTTVMLIAPSLQSGT